MATTQVDDLLVKVNTVTNTEGIDKAIRALSHLKDLPETEKAASALKTLAPALRTMSNIDGSKLGSATSGIRGLVKGLNSLAEVKGLKPVADAIEKVAPALKTLSSVSGLEKASTGIISTSKALKQ